MISEFFRSLNSVVRARNCDSRNSVRRLNTWVRIELRPAWKAMNPTTAAAMTVHSTIITTSLLWMENRDSSLRRRRR